MLLDRRARARRLRRNARSGKDNCRQKYLQAPPERAEQVAEDERSPPPKLVRHEVLLCWGSESQRASAAASAEKGLKLEIQIARVRVWPPGSARRPRLARGPPPWPL